MEAGAWASGQRRRADKGTERPRCGLARPFRAGLALHLFAAGTRRCTADSRPLGGGRQRCLLWGEALSAPRVDRKGDSGMGSTAHEAGRPWAAGGPHCCYCHSFCRWWGLGSSCSPPSPASMVAPGRTRFEESPLPGFNLDYPLVQIPFGITLWILLASLAKMDCCPL